MTFLLALLLIKEYANVEDLIGTERGGGNWFNSLNIFNKNNITIGECSERLYGNSGFNQYHTNLEGNKNICINVSTFRFFIAWENYPLDTKVIFYHSFPGSTVLVESNTSLVSDLPFFTEISAPFASITINLPSGGYIAFAYGSSPNMCKTGIKITNSLEYDQVLNDHSSGFEKLDYYEDKCLLFISQGSVNLTLKSNFDGKAQRIIFYQDIMIPKSLLDYSYTFATLDTKSHPLLVRILTQKRKSHISLTLTSNGTRPTKEDTGVFIPPSTNVCPEPVNCNLWYFVSPDMFFVCMIFSITLLLIIVATVYVFLAWKYPQVVGIENKAQDHDPTQFASTSALLEARSEPAGYFAMDQYLRPNKE
jgi:hypothetical protein